MLGFIFGTACLVGLFVVLRRNRSSFSPFFSVHRRGSHPFGTWPPGPSRLVDYIVDDLHVSPAQEKVVREALDRLHKVAREARGNLRNARTAAAEAMRADQLDPNAMSEAMAQSQLAHDRLRDAGLDSLTQVHAVLEPEQRKRLADLIANGPAWRVHAPHHRCWPAHA